MSVGKWHNASIVMIDNYDSFTFNLVQYLQQLGATVRTIRNDAMSADEVLMLKPEMIVVSPGPSDPPRAGISMELIQKAAVSRVPLLGVCLGHQAMGAAFGCAVVRAPLPMHGKVSKIQHDGKTIFSNLPSPLSVTRYHSLIVAKQNLNPDLEVSAEVDGIIMAMRHRHAPMEGVQFHPESVLTESGLKLIENFGDTYL
jgi:anthranilate synthase/aminodeoxychorismate synthase-like glutamine amidotransferase